MSLASAAAVDPVEFRLRGLANSRAIELIKRAAALMNWQPRPSPNRDVTSQVARGRGMAYVHYNTSKRMWRSEWRWLLSVRAAASRSSASPVRMTAGQIINPNGLRGQVEGCILQTLSRVLMEEVKFDRSRVVSIDWSSYPILTFSEVPKLDIELIHRPNEPPMGAGEAACTPVGAALANAVFDATGVRLRTVPFTQENIDAAWGKSS